LLIKNNQNYNISNEKIFTILILLKTHFLFQTLHSILLLMLNLQSIQHQSIQCQSIYYQSIQHQSLSKIIQTDTNCSQNIIHSQGFVIQHPLPLLNTSKNNQGNPFQLVHCIISTSNNQFAWKIFTIESYCYSIKIQEISVMIWNCFSKMNRIVWKKF